VDFSANVNIHNKKRGDGMNQRELMRHLSVLFRQRHRALRHQFEKYDIGTGEWSVLALLSRHKAGMEQTMISRELGLEKTTTARELMSLEKKGYIIREQAENDKRKKIVYVTEKAEEKIPLVKDAGNQWLRNVISGINEGELILFDKVIRKMTANAESIRERVEEDE